MAEELVCQSQELCIHCIKHNMNTATGVQKLYARGNLLQHFLSEHLYMLD